LAKPAAVFSVFSCLQTATARLLLTAAADVRVRVTEQVRISITAVVLAVDDQPFVFQVQRLIWSQQVRVAVAAGQVTALQAAEQ
jgi:hypothetical protein